MIAGKIASKTAAVAAIATAVVLCVIALGSAAWYALLLVLQPWAAALTLALVMGLLAGVIALIAFGAPRLFRRPEPEPESLTERVVALAKERPIVATVAGLAAGFIFLRNPALATIVAAALSNSPDDSRRRR
ncbi:MAG: hypothetical protein K1X35_05610 [Caulobacteraceae bacterium]|nr:hypothetical protein [Caulobacteraceae bacterium]